MKIVTFAGVFVLCVMGARFVINKKKE